MSASVGSTPRSPICVAITESAASFVIRKPLGCKLIRGTEAGVKRIGRTMLFGGFGAAIERRANLFLGWLVSIAEAPLLFRMTEQAPTATVVARTAALHTQASSRSVFTCQRAGLEPPRPLTKQKAKC